LKNPHDVTTKWLIGAILLFASLLVAAFPQPARTGSLPLPAPMAAARAVADGSRLVVLLQHDAGSALHVIDTSDQTQPRMVGSLSFAGSHGDLALTEDGRTALLDLWKEAIPNTGKPSHDLIEVDLSDPERPRVQWQEHVSAGGVALSSDASAFAFSRESVEKPGQWELVVVSGKERQRRIVIEADGYAPSSISLSAHASFLASIGPLNLWMWDLRSAEPVPFHQEFAGYDRHDRCLLAVLETGHLLTKDTRASRLGVYSAAPGIPRVTTAPLESQGSMPRCESLKWSDRATGLLVDEAAAELRSLDVRNPHAPLISGPWRLPIDTQVLTVAGNSHFAAGDRARELRIFRLDRQQSPALDWRALGAAHRAAMLVLRASKPMESFAAAWDATNRLERAGIAQALDLPLDGLSPRSAAALFNDYGLLASKAGRPPQLDESALRRAIALDSSLASAHLHLANMQRAGLARYAAEDGDVIARSNEINQHYRLYLSHGGRRTRAITEFMPEDLAPGAAETCTAIAAWTNAGRLQELVTDMATNIRWNGRRIDVVTTTEGSAHVPAIYAFDAEDDHLIPIDTPGLPGEPDSETGHLGILTLGGLHYILHYEDWTHPVRAFPLNDGNECRFEVSTRETPDRRASEPNLCAMLHEQRKLFELAFEGAAWVPPDTVLERWRETVLDGTRRVDFATDGRPLNVARLQLFSGAGAGCDSTFYDLLTEDGAEFDEGPKSHLLRQLQNVAKGDRYGAGCANMARFFVYRNRVFFENRPAQWPPADERNQYHFVKTVRKGRVVDVCGFRFTSSISAAGSGK
jgi:hypothetical protein